MPIQVITGKPRNGKTLRMMYMLQEAAKQAERPIFAAGIDGLKPGLATVLDDPTQWNAKDAQGNHLIPDGSLVFVDEAWKWFGHLHDARTQKTPLHVLDMAEHGHRALDFIFTTQGPSQLYPFIRPLIADHQHCVRVMGMQACNIYEWPELQDDPKSSTVRAMAIKTFWPYPKSLYDGYKSASGHENIKRKIPFRVMALPAVLIAAVVIGWMAFTALKPENMSAQMKASASGLPGADAPSGDHAPAAIGKNTTPEQWAMRFVPRIPEIPGSAPAWDHRAVVSEPTIACMIGERVGCICITEQGTRHVVDQFKCNAIVQHGGTYDPFKPKQDDRQNRREQGTTPAREATPSAQATTGSVLTGAQISGYGDIGIAP